MKLQFGKFLARNPLTQAVLCALIAAYIRITVWTLRLERHIAPEALPFLNGEKQAIYAFWHGRLFLFPCFKPKKRPVQVLISGHSDGRLISRVIAWFDMGTVEGSTSKKGVTALRGLLKAVKAGDNIVITPDGPRGPRQEVVPGVIYMAKTTGLPIIPATWSATPCKRLRSWDRFMIPAPFSRGMIIIGAPVFLGESVPEEEACKQLADLLNALTRQADEAMGVEW